MKYSISTPEGTKDRLFGECAKRRAVERAITAFFECRGYGEVMTPAIEYYDLFTKSGNPIPQESMLKIIDKSGSILVMRPDGTAPIARLAATKLANIAAPHRLYYNQTVFRSEAENAGGNGEIGQCGVELIGATGIKADIEVIITAIGALDACGLSDYYLELGHAGYFKALVSDLDAGDDINELIYTLAEERNFAALNDVLLPFEGKKSVAALCRMSRLFGGAEVLDEALELSSGGEADEAIVYLKTLYSELASAGYGARISFDLGMVHKIEYYTGVVFRAYVRGAADSILSGGRYDNLIGAFGNQTPATGFAIDIDAVADCVQTDPADGPTTLVQYESGSLGRAIEYIETAPCGTCVLSLCDRIEDACLEAARKNIKKLVLLTNSGEEIIEL